MPATTVVVPAYNEAGRIGTTVAELTDEYSVPVVDDGSTDTTVSEARSGGATVVEHPYNRGYIAALKRGVREATTDIIVTFDADGEHRPDDIKKLTQPIAANKLDLVLGARSTIPRPSERVLNNLTQLRLDIHDSGTGLRALRRSLAVDLELDTVCTCGTFVLEAAARGARIGEFSVETRSVQKPRGIAWKHRAQFFHLLRYLLFTQNASSEI